MNKFINIISAAGLGIALAAGSATASADDKSASRNYKNRSVTVSFSDVNLAHPAGIEMLYARLRTAAHMACGPRAFPRNIQKWRDWRECVETAVDSAVEEIAVPELQKVHVAESGNRVMGTSRTLASSG